MIAAITLVDMVIFSSCVGSASLLQTGSAKALIILNLRKDRVRLVWVRAFCAADTDRVSSIWIARCGMGSGSLEPINDLLRIG